RGGRRLLRRPRHRRPGAARRADGAPAPARTPRRVAEPAPRGPALRAARPRDGCRPAARRHLRPRPRPREPRGARRAARAEPLATRAAYSPRGADRSPRSRRAPAGAGSRREGLPAGRPPALQREAVPDDRRSEGGGDARPVLLLEREPTPGSGAAPWRPRLRAA